MARTEERAFLESYDAGEYERPSVAVNIVLLSLGDSGLSTLVVRRDEHPYKGKWSLPGCFVRMDESLDAAAARCLRDKAGLQDVFLEQLYTFGDVQRDPRTRVITVAYYALVDRARFEAARLDERSSFVGVVAVPWAGETGGAVDVLDRSGKPLRLAFDHNELLGMAVKRVRGKLGYTPIGFQLLPERFTLRQLQAVHETVLGRPLNKDSFRRRMLSSELLEATGERQHDVDHRPAELYRFSRRSAV